MFDEVVERVVKCQCTVHMALELQLLPVEERVALGGLCTLAAQNQGGMMAGNLTNLGVEVTRYKLSYVCYYLHGNTAAKHYILLQLPHYCM